MNKKYGKIILHLRNKGNKYKSELDAILTEFNEFSVIYSRFNFLINYDINKIPIEFKEKFGKMQLSKTLENQANRIFETAKFNQKLYELVLNSKNKINQIKMRKSKARVSVWSGLARILYSVGIVLILYLLGKYLMKRQPVNF